MHNPRSSYYIFLSTWQIYTHLGDRNMQYELDCAELLQINRYVNNLVKRLMVFIAVCVVLKTRVRLWQYQAIISQSL